MEDELVAWGKVLRLMTVGRRSGEPRGVAVGYVEAQGGDLFVAAASDTTHWALNLISEPLCQTELAGQRTRRRAVRLGAGERARVVRDLILKYGTPAERLGAGPAFRLESVTPGR